jgi:hypothetical protein
VAWSLAVPGTKITSGLSVLVLEHSGDPGEPDRQSVAFGRGQSVEQFCVPGAQFFPDLPGPEHPRASHREPLDTQLAERNVSLPGFGPFGTAGQHLFDQDSPSYVRIAAMCAIRSAHPVLRIGRQYPRQIKLQHTDFVFPAAGEVVAWSRILASRRPWWL